MIVITYDPWYGASTGDNQIASLAKSILDDHLNNPTATHSYTTSNLALLDEFRLLVVTDKLHFAAISVKFPDTEVVAKITSYGIFTGWPYDDVRFNTEDNRISNIVLTQTKKRRDRGL